MPLHELEERFSELEKNKTYITFCRSGVRSKAAALILLEKGIEKVYNSEDGILTWK
ncbi:MAG: rhodanese-like domain-containing protein [Cetobacterium sp.]